MKPNTSETLMALAGTLIFLFLLLPIFLIWIAGQNLWIIEATGELNVIRANDYECQTDYILAGVAATFIHVGVDGQDNSDIDVEVNNLRLYRLASVASVNENASLTL